MFTLYHQYRLKLGVDVGARYIFMEPSESVLGKGNGREYRLRAEGAMCTLGTVSTLCSLFLSGQGSSRDAHKDGTYTVSQLSGIRELPGLQEWSAKETPEPAGARQRSWVTHRHFSPLLWETLGGVSSVQLSWVGKAMA